MFGNGYRFAGLVFVLQIYSRESIMEDRTQWVKIYASEASYVYS